MILRDSPAVRKRYTIRIMRQYLDLLADIRQNGIRKSDRTGTGTISVFGRQARLNLRDGFPLLTTKRVHIKSVVAEMLWLLRGETNIHPLQKEGVAIWNEWADKKGELGPIYGRQWRAWPSSERGGGGIDQIANAVEQIKRNPDSRRIVVTAMNVADFPDDALSPQENASQGKMALMPCHSFFQFYVNQGMLSCLLYCRSQDVFLGTPFNWAGYALLVYMMAQQCDLSPGELIWTGGDCHLYLNHLSQAELQLSREPKAPPQLIIRRRPPSIFDYELDDFEFVGYDPASPIAAPISI